MANQRRHRLDLMDASERAIQHAMGEIEKIGADTRLTEAQTLLQKAKDLVSDFLDDQEQASTQGDSQPNPPPPPPKP
jgi:hypothetical protein